MMEMSYHGPVQSHLCMSPSQTTAVLTLVEPPTAIS